MNVRTRPTRWILTFCCALALGACTTWEPQSAPAPAGRELRAVRLTLNDGSAVVLERAEFRGDSVAGTLPKTRVPAAVALADVKRTEIERIDPAATFWTGALGVAAGFFGFIYWAFHGEAT